MANITALAQVSSGINGNVDISSNTLVMQSALIGGLSGTLLTKSILDSLIAGVSGAVTTVTASAPLSSSGGSAPNITITQATGSSDGYLSQGDWNTFNNTTTKVNAATPANAGSTLVSRDSAGNSSFNNVSVTVTEITASGQTIAMTYGSAGHQRINGSANITFNLPDATYMVNGELYWFNNNSTGTITLYKYDGSTLLGTVPAGGLSVVICIDNSSQNGNWDAHSWLAEGVVSGTSGTSFPGNLSAANFSGSSSGTNTGDASAISQVLTGYTVGSNTPIAATDTILQAFGKVQAQLNMEASGAITALTGDGTATGPGSSAFTLATVNTNVGSFGSATAVATFTVNGKGLITAAGSTPIQIAESQVTGLVSDLAATEKTANKGAASGYAPLDASSKIPVAYLPSVVMEYQGAWNPNTNTPTLSDATGTNGYVYYVTAARATAVSGLSDPSMVNFQIGDLVIYSSAVSKWQLVTPAAGVSSVNGAQGAVTVNAINQLTGGDVSTSAASGSQSLAATINAGAVTLAKMANLAANSIIGNNTGSAATPIALSTAQVTAMLNQFSSTLQGLAPASGGGSSNFLRADGTWAVPAGTGANTTLSNLGATAVNVAIIPVTSAIDLGSTSIPWAHLYTQNVVNPLVASNLQFATAAQTGSNASGSVTIGAGNTVNGNAGNIVITAGAATGAGTSGYISLQGTAINCNSSPITNATWNGAIVGVTYGGTGVSSYTALTAALNQFTSSLQGLVPGSGGGTSNFLRADGTWAIPAGTGVTSVGMTVPSFLSVTPSSITSTGTFAVSYSGTALPIANGGTGSTTQNFVDLSTTQTVGGAKTFSSALAISAASNQIVLGTTNTLTLSSAQASAQTMTIPAIAAADTLATLGLAQTFSGAKTFSSAITISASSAQIKLGTNLTISSPTQTSAFTLTIPNITANDTLPTLGLAQTFSAIQTFTLAPVFSSVTASQVLAVTAGKALTSLAYAAAPAATTIAQWDANKNISANAVIPGFTTTATAGATTTMTIASTQTQVWTGTLAQTVKLPTTSVAAGAQYTIINLSSGAVTVQSSGANTIQVMAANTQLIVTALVATPTTAANWNFAYSMVSGTALPISLGGTGSTTQNFVDLSTGQTVGGAKTFSSALAISASSAQLVLGTNLTISSPTQTSAFTATIPNITANDTFAMLAQAQTLTNKTIAAGSNTITGLTNSNLSGSAGITGANIAANTVTATNISTTAVDGTTITGGNGTPLSVVGSGTVTKSFTAGQAFSANTTYAVRLGQPSQGETAGQIYAADYSTSTTDRFWVIGLFNSTSAVSIGNSVNVTMEGQLTLGSSDTTFGTADQGYPVWLGSSGAFLPNSTGKSPPAGDASVKLGMAMTASTILVNISVMGVA